MAKITVTKLFRTDALGVCGACVTLEFYKDGKRVHEEVFSGKISDSVFVRTIELPEYDHVMHTVLPGNYGVNFEYSIDYTAPWAGEGLPPVGLEVERSMSQHSWKRTTICGHSTDGAYASFYDGDGLMGWSDDCKFRPIRTAEQIAAEEREAQVDKMLDLFEGAAGKQNYDMRAGIEAIYDGGYQK